MKTRTDLLNHLAEKYNLQRYLEIGVQHTAQNFDKINCKYKVCVDPDPAANASFCLDSDAFFELILQDSWMGSGNYDLIFIDGLHTAEQVKKDFENALKILSPNGFIVLHDCNPLKEEHTIVPRPTERGHWNGDVYKFASIIFPKVTVDIDNGMTVFKGSDDYKPGASVPTWEGFMKHRQHFLNLISWEEFTK
jgi:hypothetical protein